MLAQPMSFHNQFWRCLIMRITKALFALGICGLLMAETCVAGQCSSNGRRFFIKDRGCCGATPTCCGATPTCCAPAPTCCAPAPAATCCAPAPTSGAAARAETYSTTAATWCGFACIPNFGVGWSVAAKESFDALDKAQA